MPRVLSGNPKWRESGAESSLQRSPRENRLKTQQKHFGPGSDRTLPAHRRPAACGGTWKPPPRSVCGSLPGGRGRMRQERRETGFTLNNNQQQHGPENSTKTPNSTSKTASLTIYTSIRLPSFCHLKIHCYKSFKFPFYVYKLELQDIDLILLLHISCFYILWGSSLVFWN